MNDYTSIFVFRFVGFTLKMHFYIWQAHVTFSQIHQVRLQWLGLFKFHIIEQLLNNNIKNDSVNKVRNNVNKPCYCNINNACQTFRPYCDVAISAATEESPYVQIFIADMKFGRLQNNFA